MLILKGEKYEGLYKRKEENSLRSRVSWISLEGSSSQGEASRKISTRHKHGQCVAERRNGAFGKGPRWPKV